MVVYPHLPQYMVPDVLTILEKKIILYNELHSLYYTPRMLGTTTINTVCHIA
jgi:hypothetical protein